MMVTRVRIPTVRLPRTILIVAVATLALWCRVAPGGDEKYDPQGDIKVVWLGTDDQGPFWIPLGGHVPLEAVLFPVPPPREFAEGEPIWSASILNLDPPDGSRFATVTPTELGDFDVMAEADISSDMVRIAVVQPTVNMPDATVAIGATKALGPSVDAGPLAPVVQEIQLGITTAPDPLIATAAWATWGDQTNGSGEGLLSVTGHGAGTTSLTVSASVSGASDSGVITVVAPTITVDSKSVNVGTFESIGVHVTAGGSEANDVELSIGSIATSVATAAFAGGMNKAENGLAIIVVTGVATGNTSLIVNATASGASGSGTITVP